MKEAKSLAGLRYLDNLKNADTAVVLFHGYGASMRDLYGISEVIPGQADWYFPDGPVSVPLGFMMEGRAWFSIDMAELERAMASGSHRDFENKNPERFALSQKEALEFLKALRPKYKKLVVGGFSQGAMLASHVFAQAEADGLVLFSGVLIDREGLQEKLTGHPGISFLQTHGDSDPLLQFEQGRRLFKLLEERGLSGEFVRFSGGHEIPEKALRSFANYLGKITRP